MHVIKMKVKSRCETIKATLLNPIMPGGSKKVTHT